jgi:hypothetical protein
MVAEYRIVIEHLNPGLVRYLDVHCIIIVHLPNMCQKQKQTNHSSIYSHFKLMPKVNMA